MIYDAISGMAWMSFYYYTQYQKHALIQYYFFSCYELIDVFC